MTERRRPALHLIDYGSTLTQSTTSVGIYASAGRAPVRCHAAPARDQDHALSDARCHPLELHVYPPAEITECVASQHRGGSLTAGEWAASGR